MKTRIAIAILCAACCILPPKAEAEMQTKYTAHATSSVVMFPPRSGQTVVTAIGAESDKAGSLIQIYAKTGDEQIVTATPTNGATVISISNPATVMTNSDLIVYYHDTSGTLDYTTVSSATTSNITLAAGISEAGTAADVVYEVSLQGKYAVGNAALALDGTGLFASPKDSPVRIVVDSTSAGWVNATAIITP